MPSAFGIPDKIEKGDLSKLQSGQIVDLVLQKHDAERAGEHLDFRFGTEETGLYSWAIRKGLPEEPGQKRLAIRQPLHEYSYKNFSGIIPSGYGKGKVETELGTILIDKIEPDKIVFTRSDIREPQRFALIRVPKYGEDKWLLINITPSKPHGIPKPHYKSIPPEEAENIIKNLKPTSIVQAKLDGARSLIFLTNEMIEVYSQRTNVSGKPILYTEKIFEKIPELKNLPDSLVNAILVGELIGIKDNKAIPVNRLSGILNSTIEKAIKTKRKEDIEFIVYLFDIIRLKGYDVDKLLPKEKVELLNKIKNELPEHIRKYFQVIETAYSKEEAKKLLEKIKFKQHPLTYEGIVIYEEGKKPIKSKFFQEYDVYIRAIFPGTGKYKNAAGGFYYSFTPNGPIVGKVGTGFDDDMRFDMMKNPEQYIGRKARVTGLELTNSGSIRNPAFIALHEG